MNRDATSLIPQMTASLVRQQQEQQPQEEEQQHMPLPNRVESSSSTTTSTPGTKNLVFSLCFAPPPEQPTSSGTAAAPAAPVERPAGTMTLFAGGTDAPWPTTTTTGPSSSLVWTAPSHGPDPTNRASPDDNDDNNDRYFTVEIRQVYLQPAHSIHKHGWDSLVSLDLNATELDSLNGRTNSKNDNHQKPQGLQVIVDSGTTETYLSQSVQTKFQTLFNQMAVGLLEYRGGLTGHALYQLSPYQLESLPTIWLQLVGDERRNSLVSFSLSTTATNIQSGSLARDVDPQHAMDVLVAIPPTQYMEYLAESHKWTFGVFANEPSGAVLGANVLMGHEVAFDMDANQVGWAPSDCRPTTTTNQQEQQVNGTSGGIGTNDTSNKSEDTNSTSTVKEKEEQGSCWTFRRGLASSFHSSSSSSSCSRTRTVLSMVGGGIVVLVTVAGLLLVVFQWGCPTKTESCWFNTGRHEAHPKGATTRAGHVRLGFSKLTCSGDENDTDEPDVEDTIDSDRTTQDSFLFLDQGKDNSHPDNNDDHKRNSNEDMPKPERYT